MEPDLVVQMETFAHSRTPQLSWVLGSEDCGLSPEKSGSKPCQMPSGSYGKVKQWF